MRDVRSDEQYDTDQSIRNQGGSHAANRECYRCEGGGLRAGRPDSSHARTATGVTLDSRTVAVIVGGAGGIGRALAAEISASGGKVVLVDIDRSALESAVVGLARGAIYECDIRDAAAVERLAREIDHAHGAATLLVNAAGVSVAGPVEAVPLEAFMNVVAVNFWGTVHTSLAFLPHLRRSRALGRATAVCNILSDFAFVSPPTKSAYAASKYAARAFTEALGAELHDAGISVTAAFVGATATQLVRRGVAVDREKQAREAAFLERGMLPERVARKVLRAVVRRRARVVVGVDARALALATRLSPALVEFAMRRAGRLLPFL